MYRIIKTDGTEVGFVETPRYIKVAGNGSFIEADEADAVGIAYAGTPYNLSGNEAIEGADTVILSPASMEDVVTRQREITNAALAEREDALCDLDTTYAERVAAVEDALCDLDAEMNE